MPTFFSGEPPGNFFNGKYDIRGMFSLQNFVRNLILELTNPFDDVSNPKSVKMLAKVGKIDRKPKCARTFECDAIEC